MAEEGVEEGEIGYTSFPFETEGQRTKAPARYRRRQRPPQTEGSNGNEKRKGDKVGDPPPDVEQHERISISDDSDEDDSDYDVESIAESEVDHLTWRGRMQYVLHSHYTHIIIVILVVLDAFIVLFELLLDVGAFNNVRCRGETSHERQDFCHYLEPEICYPRAALILTSRNISASPDGHTFLCYCGIRHGKRVCLREDTPSGVNPSLILHIASLLILAIFVLEVLLKLIAFRLKYFTHRFEVFDGIVVMVSFALDIASLEEEEAFEAASLLIILRLWRVVRIVNGAVLSAKSRSDAQLEEAKSQARKIIHALHKCKDKLSATEEENTELKKKLEEAREQEEDTEVEKREEGPSTLPLTVDDVRVKEASDL